LLETTDKHFHASPFGRGGTPKGVTERAKLKVNLINSLKTDKISKFYLSVQRESNPHRITAALSGAFGFIVLDLRQQACVLCIQNHPNNSRRNVLCSFFGADFRPDEALAAGNTWRILKANNEVWAYIRPIKTDAGSIPVGPGRKRSLLPALATNVPPARLLNASRPLKGEPSLFLLYQHAKAKHFALHSTY